MYRKTFQNVYDQDDYDGRAYHQDAPMENLELRRKFIYTDPEDKGKFKGPGYNTKASRVRRYTQAPGADRKAA